MDGFWCRSGHKLRRGSTLKPCKNVLYRIKMSYGRKGLKKGSEDIKGMLTYVI